MKPFLYFQPRNALQAYYYGVRLKSSPNASFLGVKGELPEYLGKYLLMKEVHRRLHPFQFVRAGDTVIHVGFDRVYLDKGQSHPLILSSLVGARGCVLAIDPDSRNTDALRDYARRSDIGNMKVDQGAAWNKPSTLEFIFDGEWSPMSTATNVLSDPSDYHPGKGSTRQLVQAVTIDSLVAEHLPDRHVTYLSLTANGAEPEILEGADGILRSCPELRIVIALSNWHHFSYGIRKDTCNRLGETGFKIAVADAPHDPWYPTPFFFACAVKMPEDQLLSLGFQPSDWAMIERAGHVKEAAIEAGRRRLMGKPARLAVAVISKLTRGWMMKRGTG